MDLSVSDGFAAGKKGLPALAADFAPFIALHFARRARAKCHTPLPQEGSRMDMKHGWSIGLGRPPLDCSGL